MSVLPAVTLWLPQGLCTHWQCSRGCDASLQPWYFPPWARVVRLFQGFGIALHTSLGTVGFAWGSSTLRVSVFSDLLRLCRGKTGVSAQLLLLHLFPILELGAGAGRSFYRPQQGGEGTLCQATLLTQKLVAVPCLWVLLSNSSLRELSYGRGEQVGL